MTSTDQVLVTCRCGRCVTKVLAVVRGGGADVEAVLFKTNQASYPSRIRILDGRQGAHDPSNLGAAQVDAPRRGPVPVGVCCKRWQAVDSEDLRKRSAIARRTGKGKGTPMKTVPISDEQAAAVNRSMLRS